MLLVNLKFSRRTVSMLGPKIVKSVIASALSQFGTSPITMFISSNVMDFSNELLLIWFSSVLHLGRCSRCSGIFLTIYSLF